MFGQRRTWWANMKSTLDQCIVLTGTAHAVRTMTQRWGHVDPQSETYQNTAITEHTHLSKYTNFVNNDYLINNSFFSV